jgi:hypothetical protein
MIAFFFNFSFQIQYPALNKNKLGHRSKGSEEYFYASPTLILAAPSPDWH